MVSLQLPRADEIALLVDETRAEILSDAVLSSERAGLFAVPPHLTDVWWQAAENLDGGDADGEAYERFVHETVRFLAFKQLPLPKACGFDVRVSKPGQRSTRLDPAGVQARGLSFAGMVGEERRTVAWLNLGDEDSHLVFCNLPLPRLRALTAERGIDLAVPSTEPLLAGFFETVPGYPLARLRLAPGEGLWFPQAPIAYDGDTIGKQEIDVVLTLSGRADSED